MLPGLARTALLACSLLAASLVACGDRGAARNTDPAAPVVLVRGNGPEPDSLDPHRARTVESGNVLRDLYEGLTRLDGKAAPIPAAAESWTVSPDGRIYTFKLRAGLQWSNGDPLVAEDFVAGLRRLVNPVTASQYAQVVNVIENATDITGGRQPPEALGVSAPDAQTVVIRLVSPAPYLPGLLAHPTCAPLHRPSFAEHGDLFTRAGKMVGNGAFTLTEWLQGSHVRVTRNPRYWNNAANKIDAVKFLHIADENAELRAYRANELHFTAVVPRGQFDWIRANLGKELHISPQLNTYFYGFNLDRPLFAANPKLRQALSMVIDRERLATSVLRVGELPAYGWVPPGTLGHTPQSFEYAKLTHAERVAKARALYADAGYSREKPLRFDLRYNAGEVHSKVAVAVAAMWKEALGVEARLSAVEFKSLIADIDRREVDLFRLSWLGDYNDPYTFLQYLKGGFGVNLPHYSNPAYDKLLDEAATQTDVARRRELLESAERIALSDHPLIPLYFYVTKHLVKPEVRGWSDNVMNIVYSQDLEIAPQ
jgi:oligopeptide transport system substrate-binding protein